MLKIVAISDTHTFENAIAVPDGDVLIHAGDATIEGSYREVSRFADWLHAQPHRHKIFVAGNHDWLFEREPEIARSLLVGVAYYLQDELIEIEGVKFYGSPWQPEFCNWAFNLPRGEALAAKWAMIPNDVDVLITHGPPWGILDYVKLGSEHLGCNDLLRAVARVQPRVHVFGHIHGGYARFRPRGLFINASICNEAYQPINAPQVFTIEARSDVLSAA